jgi:hypothetical protein
LLFHGFVFVFGDSNLPWLNPSATPSSATTPKDVGIFKVLPSFDS